MTNLKPYSPRSGFKRNILTERTNLNAPEFYVDGPGNGFGTNAGTLWPNLRLSTEKDAEAAAALCNTAYSEGYRQAQADILQALGLNRG